jgi:DNA repair ATPase RecN
MSLAQLGARMNMTAQGTKEMERREEAGSISVNNLKQAAQALGLKLTYGFISEAGDLEEILDRLDLYQRLKKKFGGEISQVLQILQDYQKEYEMLKNSEENIKTFEAATFRFGIGGERSNNCYDNRESWMRQQQSRINFEVCKG